MDPVGDLVVVKPVIILFHDGLVDRRAQFRQWIFRLKKGIGQQLSQFAVTQVVQQGPVHGVGLAIGIPFGGWTECVDEQDTVPLGHFAHSLDVQDEVGVLYGSVGHALHGLNCGGGDQSDSRSCFSIVFLGRDMLQEGIELLFESLQFLLAVEGRIEAKEGKYDVGLQASEPLIGSFEVPPWSSIDLQFRANQLLGSGESVLAVLFAAGMRTKPRGVPFIAQVPYGQLLQREAEVQFGLEMAVVNHSRSHACPDERNAIPFLQGQI